MSFQIETTYLPWLKQWDFFHAALLILSTPCSAELDFDFALKGSLPNGGGK
jgi:hypothetical protein